MFEPNWDSLNARETPAWFRDAKFGIFIHWGVYSVPALCHKSTYSEWYWHWLKTNSHDGFVRKFHETWYGKDFTYQDFAPMFRAELWNPREWAQLFKRAGAKYVVLVSKHHDGYALWPSEQASKTRGHPWNSIEVGPKRDLCGDLAEAVRAEGLKMGFYYSLLEWENPLFDTDKAKYVEEHMIPQIKDLVTRYKPAVLWPDGEWSYPDTLWRSPELVAWLYNHVENYEEFTVNDRWGRGLRGQVGDYYTTEYGHVGGGSPGLKEDKPFEECRGIGRSFAFNRLENYDDYQTRESLVQMFITLVSQGGSLLLNIGPDADGTIPVIMQDRLIAIGDWLAVHGESIYGTSAGLIKRLPWGASTTKGNTLYLHVFEWPADNTLEVEGLMTPVKKASLLHDPRRKALAVTARGSGAVSIDLSSYHPYPNASVIALEFEGAPEVVNGILPDAHGVLVLPAERAELKGGLKLEKTTATSGDATVGIANEETACNIGYWLKTEGSASWTARLTPNTAYRVTALYACKPGSEGGAFAIDIGGKEIKGRFAEATGGWQTYRPLDLGTFQAGDVADATIVMKAVDIPGEALGNVRWIKLEPAR